jgi:hypothetical protein
MTSIGLRSSVNRRDRVAGRLRENAEEVTSLLLMLRIGRHCPGKKTWGPAHMNWLMLRKLEHREQRTVLEKLLGGSAPGERACRASGAGDRIGKRPAGDPRPRITGL